jgi:hypothetical protein
MQREVRLRGGGDRHHRRQQGKRAVHGSKGVCMLPHAASTLFPVATQSNTQRRLLTPFRSSKRTPCHVPPAGQDTGGHGVRQV